jgi:D-amino-acid dehydrogenase
MEVVIIGGGINGLSSAYYLQEAGHQVTIIDQTDITNNCSYGNAGYICPSHFVPLATPGIVQQGLKWMLNSKSPFYIQPRLSKSLIQWGWKFMQSATEEKVEAAAIPLRDYALFSQQLYTDWAKLPQFNFAYEHKGLLEIFQTASVEEHAHHTVEKANQIGLTGTRMISKGELDAMEPNHPINARGAIYFACDAHLYPQKMMQQLIDDLKNKGVRFALNETVIDFEKKHNAISKVITNKAAYNADTVVLASGAWSRELAEKLGINIPLVGGRGYSITLEDSPYMTNHSAVLVEGRIALTPMDGNKMRFGGTMEITSTNTPPKLNRVKGIVEAVKKYFPTFDIPVPAIEDVWYGYRPCSADGLPYVGRTKKCTNLIMATGHAMVGMSLGAATGKIVTEIIQEQKPSIDIAIYNPERFDA